MLLGSWEHVGMEKSTKRRVKEIIGQINCPKDFVCYKSEVNTLCKAGDVGMQSHLKWLEENPSDCVSSLGYAELH